MHELEKTYAELVSWMIANPLDVMAARREIQHKLIKKRFVYGNAAMQTTLMPVFLRQSSLEKIRRTSQVLDGIIEKVICAYFTDEYVRSYFPLHTELPAEWLNSESGYSRASVINRHDVIFDGKTLKFIEFNTDNPGGKGWTDLLTLVFREYPLYADLIDFSGLEDRAVLKGLLRELLTCNQEFGGPDRPRIALASFRNITSRGDEEIVRDYFIENGLCANLIDPRDLELRDGKLYSNGVKFDLILRSLKARLFLNYPRELEDFHRGVSAGAACMVNSWRCLLGAERSLFSFMTNPINFKYFSSEEVEVVKAHVPWTRMFDESVVHSPSGEEVSLKSYVLENRERLVIKPSSGVGGQGVLVGKNTAPVLWRDAIEDNLGNPAWVVQEYVEIPQIDMPVIKSNQVVVEKKYLNLSPFVFGGKYVGILGRVSSQDVVNVSAGGGMIPVFPVRKELEATESA